MERPDLSQVSPEIRAYIESLENELERRQKKAEKPTQEVSFAPLEPSEPPTTINIVTISQNGLIKRTARHNYERQHRGGMGVFDLDVSGDDYPSALTAVDESQGLLLFTNLARVFRLPLAKIDETPLRSRGSALREWLPLSEGEHVAAALPALANGYVALLSQRGMVRCLRHHLFGEYLKPGTAFFNPRDFGELASACWTPGDADLFVATRNGMAIRFPEKLVPVQGGSGIRVDAQDSAASITSVRPDGQVLLVGEDGKGTLRLMSGFNPNKSAGGGGKLAMRASTLVAAFSATEKDDVFLLSKTGKIIRFKVDEVPPTEGVIQGVNCMALRSDEISAATISATGPSHLFR